MEDFKKMYNDSCDIWAEIINLFNHMAKNNIKEDPRYFWASHQRFFRYLLISAKVNPVVKMAYEALAEGFCVRPDQKFVWGS